MGTTAIDEQRGGSIDVTFSSPTAYAARLPSGPNGVRLYVVRPAVPGSTFRLPNPAYCTVGADPLCVIVNKGTSDIAITNYAGTVLYFLGAGTATEYHLREVGVDVWDRVGTAVVNSGASLNGSRKPLELVYSASNATFTNARFDAAKQYGYTASDGPVALQITVKSGVVLGADRVDTPALFTGFWPTGSTCFVTVEPGAYICGRGGTGGIGENAVGVPGTEGQAGGIALALRLPSAIMNLGTIAGGGGGGGGARRRFFNNQWYAGGSGGGGAGAQGGLGGAAAAGFPQTQGNNGTLENFGFGGWWPEGFEFPYGGSGGSLGQVGGVGSGSVGPGFPGSGVPGWAGGLPGTAIQYSVAAGSPVYVPYGTILGLTVVVP